VSAPITRRAVLRAGTLAVVSPAGWPGRALAAATDDIGALNGLLAMEHAAIYDLAAAGATLTVPARAVVFGHYDQHRARRDLLEQHVRRLGGAPVAALAAYADPVAGPLGPAGVVAVEQACVQGYHAAVAVVADAGARELCSQAFVTEAAHLALARAATGAAGAPVAFVTGE
jgi:hypothetical protein